MMRKRARANRFAAGATALALLALPAVASADTQFWIVGRGFGHGIGLSQYGAKGFADRGYLGSTIVKYYYQGAEIGSAPADAQQLDVLLRGGMSSARFEIDADATLSHGSSAFVLLAGDRLTFTRSGAAVSASRTRAGATAQLFSADAATSTIAGPDGAVQTLFTADNGFAEHHYRGTLVVTPAAGGIDVVDSVPIESYLRSVVPAEMPSAWPVEALKAQAIAARSYGIANRRAGSFDLYCDTRSQMYAGLEHEQASTDGAVAATAGQVATYGGAVIPAYFSSASGGRTAANEDVWGGSPRPYLRSKPDPYEVSPYTPWRTRIAYSPGALRARLAGRVQGALRNVFVVVNDSARADEVRLVGSGGSTSVSPATFQAELGLRSTWFRVERLSIFVRAAARVQKNPGLARRAAVRRARRWSVVRVSGVVPRAGATLLVYRDNGAGPWSTLRAVAPHPNGSFAMGVPRPPSGVRIYRLKRRGWLGPSVRLTS